MPSPDLRGGVLFLCDKASLTRERLGYYNAFAKRCVAMSLDRAPSECDISSSEAALAIHDGYYALPNGVERARAVTCCMHIDTFDGLAHRIRIAELFDYNFVFHPGFESQFKEHGIPRAGFLAHAVDAALFLKPIPEKLYDVGWVGSLVLKEHASRRERLLNLQKKFVLNDIDRHYSPEEMALVYSQSKIVVNFPRSDYPRDANLRCFEAMAAGALLLTRHPTELTSLGFSAGEHFATYSREEEIDGLVDHYERNADARERISAAGRALVLEKHTYDARVDSMLDFISKERWEKAAPARSWDARKIRHFHVWYLASQWRVPEVLKEVRLTHGGCSRLFIAMYAAILLLRFGFRRFRHLAALIRRRA